MRAKSAGNNISPPDFAWHSSVLVNEDRLCHKVNTPTVLARTQEINRLLQLYHMFVFQRKIKRLN
jgi:hypothetical protein